MDESGDRNGQHILQDVYIFMPTTSTRITELEEEA